MSEKVNVPASAALPSVMKSEAFWRNEAMLLAAQNYDLAATVEAQAKEIEELRAQLPKTISDELEKTKAEE